MQVPIAHKTHGFSPTEGFLDSSISPDIFLRKRLCMDFSSIFLSLSPWGALHLAWVAAILVMIWIFFGLFFLKQIAKERSQKQAYWLQYQLFETNCLQRGLLLAVVLNYLAVRGRCYLPGLASTLVLLQPPVLTSTDVFLRYTLHSCSWRLFNYF